MVSMETARRREESRLGHYLFGGGVGRELGNFFRTLKVVHDSFSEQWHEQDFFFFLHQRKNLESACSDFFPMAPALTASSRRFSLIFLRMRELRGNF